MKNWSFLIIVFWAQLAIAQIAPMGEVGFQRSLQGREGLVFNSKKLRFAMLSTPRTAADLESDIRIRESFILYRFDPYDLNARKISIDKRKKGVKGYSFYPAFAAGLTFATEKNAENSYNKNTWGLALTPSYNLNFPFCGIEFNMNSMLYFKNSTSLGRLRLEPSIAFKFDGLFEILDSDVDFGQRTTELIAACKVDKVTYNKESTIIDYHYEPTLSNREYYYWAVGNFGGITPRYTYTRQSPYVGNTSLFGLGYNFRFNMAAIDFIAETGQLGYASNLEKPAFTCDPKPQNNGVNRDSAQYAAEGGVSRVFFRYGVDIWQMLMRFGNKQSAATGADVSLGSSTVKGSNRNGAFRVMAGLGGGYAWVKQPQFVYANARLKLDSKFNEKPDLLHNAYNDPSKTKNGPILHYFVSVEFGVVAFEWSTTQMFDGPLGTAGPYKNLSISYTVPINRILKTYQSIKADKEYLKEHSK